MSVDAELGNADWPKRTWDIYDYDGNLVTTLAQLRTLYPDEPTAYFKRWLDLPSGQSMPIELRRAIEALIL